MQKNGIHRKAIRAHSLHAQNRWPDPADGMEAFLAFAELIDQNSLTRHPHLRR